MNERPPDAEALVDESWLAHGGVRNTPIVVENGCSLPRNVKFGFVKIDPNSLFDNLGIDREIVLNFGKGWVRFAIQIKTSNNGETVGVVLPIREPSPPKLMARLSREMLDRIPVHDNKHPPVDCMLFVDAWGSLTNKAEVLDEIWRETKKIVNIKCKLLTGRYVW